MSGIRKFKARWILWLVVSFFILVTVTFLVLPPKGHISVLMYHFVLPEFRVGTSSLNVSVDEFRRQMWFLKTFGFRVISLDELYDIKTGKAKPRGKEVVVTFDDGNISYLEFALPILALYQIKSANFLIWEHLERRWPDDISLEKAQLLSYHSLVTLGSHTLSHPNLLEVSAEQAQTEIMESKGKLEKALSHPVHYFSYPSGFFDQRTMKLVQEAGYRLAFTTARKRLSGNQETLYSIPRIKIGPKDNLFIFWLHVSGLTDYVKRIDHFCQRMFHRLTGNGVGGKLTVYKPGYETM